MEDWRGLGQLGARKVAGGYAARGWGKSQSKQDCTLALSGPPGRGQPVGGALTQTSVIAV